MSKFLFFNEYSFEWTNESYWKVSHNGHSIGNPVDFLRDQYALYLDKLHLDGIIAEDKIEYLDRMYLSHITEHVTNPDIRYLRYWMDTFVREAGHFIWFYTRNYSEQNAHDIVTQWKEKFL